MKVGIKKKTSLRILIQLVCFDQIEKQDSVSIDDDKERRNRLSADVFDRDFVNVVNVVDRLALAGKELALPLYQLGADRVSRSQVSKLA
ncbi:MAG: hypothetical protein IH944_06950 [Armatimonadetes bacterium]|nr:hypothetical protein [Armatimonadota bacterium]